MVHTIASAPRQEQKNPLLDIKKEQPVPEDKGTTQDLSEDNFSKLLEEELKKNSGPGVRAPQDISWGWQILKTAFALLVIIGFFAIFWKFYSFRQKVLHKDSAVIRLLYEYHLDNGRKLNIIQLHNKLLLLGVSEAGIQLLNEISEKNEIDQIKLDCEKENIQEKPDFLMELTKAFKEKFSGQSQKKSLFNMASPKTDIDVSSMRSISQTKLDRIKQSKHFL